MRISFLLRGLRVKMVGRVSIIIPTYNERENLRSLVERIDRALSGYEIIVVDDNSPDKTGDLAENLSKTYPIKVIHRKRKEGLSSAVIEGFKSANGDIFAVIDADLQHPPETLPELLKGLDRGDLVIGSRHVKGGEIEGWSLKRRIISSGAKTCSNILLPSTRSIKDPLSGFFLLKKEVIEGVSLDPVGYKILLEILIKGDYNRVMEVPYTFKDREHGESNLNIREELNYLRHLTRLARHDNEFLRLFKFCFVGFSGVFVNEGLLWWLTEGVGIYYLVSALFAVQSAILSNFFFNHLWTFRDRREKDLSIVHRLGRFELVCIAGMCTNIAVLWIFTEAFNIHYLLSNLVGISLGFIVNFIGSDRWAWENEEV